MESKGKHILHKMNLEKRNRTDELKRMKILRINIFDRKNYKRIIYHEKVLLQIIVAVYLLLSIMLQEKENVEKRTKIFLFDGDDQKWKVKKWDTDLRNFEICTDSHNSKWQII